LVLATTIIGRSSPTPPRRDRSDPIGETVIVGSGLAYPSVLLDGTGELELDFLDCVFW
jgi:hypothetical protein